MVAVKATAPLNFKNFIVPPIIFWTTLTALAAAFGTVPGASCQLGYRGTTLKFAIDGRVADKFIRPPSISEIESGKCTFFRPLLHPKMPELHSIVKDPGLDGLNDSIE
ncbi:MAG: hypothetical protein ACK5JT_22990 [Hyphomicrobiaceae bacterium]